MGLAERVVSKEALQEARAKGEANGKAKARADYVLRILDARDIPLNRSTRERILACRDLAQLDRWFEQALRANSLAEVLDEPARRRSRRRSIKQVSQPSPPTNTLSATPRGQPDVGK